MIRLCLERLTLAALCGHMAISRGVLETQRGGSDLSAWHSVPPSLMLSTNVDNIVYDVWENDFFLSPWCTGFMVRLWGSSKVSKEPQQCQILLLLLTQGDEAAQIRTTTFCCTPSTFWQCLAWVLCKPNSTLFENIILQSPKGLTWGYILNNFNTLWTPAFPFSLIDLQNFFFIFGEQLPILERFPYKPIWFLSNFNNEKWNYFFLVELSVELFLEV
jgi:hypothetical protein